MLLDLHDPSIVRYRSIEPILEPDEKETYEFDGPYHWGICFPCGNVVIGDRFIAYYGGADKHVGVASCILSDLLDYLLTCPVKPSVTVKVARPAAAARAGQTRPAAV
jgi:predicted GH43/DUF377 family glycosyl hydrolase